jgi:hypothetical protein
VSGQNTIRSEIAGNYPCRHVGARTGCPVLVNSSFGVRSETIVRTQKDTLRLLYGTARRYRAATTRCNRFEIGSVGRMKEKLVNAGLLITSVILSLLAFEIGLRAYHGGWHYKLPIPGGHLVRSQSSCCL